MKKIYTIMLAVLLVGIAAQAQEADYQPLVREGVVWVNHSQFVYYGDETYYGPIETEMLQFSGEKVITTQSGTHTYKIVQGAYRVYMRESDKKVYLLDQQEAPEEVLLYDFSKNDTAIYNNGHGFVENFVLCGMVEIDGNQCRVFKNSAQNTSYIVESVGLVSKYYGDLIHTSLIPYAGGGSHYYCNFDHLEDMDGNIIYKAPWYKDPSDIYQPLVREGVRWIYQDSGTDTATGNTLRYYAMEIHGDTLINTTNGRWLYYRCYKYPFSKAESSAAVDFSSLEPIAYLKEASKKIFCLDSLTVLSHGWYDELVEPVLYDFSNAEHATLGNPLDGNNLVFSFAGTVQIDGNDCLAFDCEDNNSFGQLVQSVGFVSAENGDLLGLTDNKCGLSHVIDADGNIIYRGPNWHFFASDLNGDCKVDIADVSQAVNAILGRSDNPGTDINGDGKVDIGDVNAVINAMLGKE